MDFSFLLNNLFFGAHRTQLALNLVYLKSICLRVFRVSGVQVVMAIAVAVKVVVKC